MFSTQIHRHHSAASTPESDAGEHPQGRKRQIESDPVGIQALRRQRRGARKSDFPFKKRTEGRQEPATNRQRRAPLMAPLLIAGWFIGTFIAKVADLGILYVKNQYEYRDVKGKLKQLEKNLRKIQAALFEVDKRRITNPGLEEWLWDLKDSVYAAEDVIDGFEYNLLEDIAKGKNQLFFEEKSNDRAKIKNKFIDTLKLLAFCKEDLNQLDDAIKKFSELVDELGKLLKVVELNVATNKKDDAEIPNWRRTTSPVKPRPLRGRDDEVTKLKMLLKTGNNSNPDSNSFSLVSIVGPGGIGKTELARLVYNEENLNFHIKAWVCVCNNFNVRRLSIEIIESAAFHGHIVLHSINNLDEILKLTDLHSISNLDEIQKILSKCLMGKRFLVVLDDVWEESVANWENLCTAFRSGLEGSRIIVTTQLESVAKMMGTKDIVNLDGLDDKVNWELLKECSLRDQNHAEHRRLERIGWEISQKLGGSPLAAVTVGRALKYDLKEEHWRRILHKKIYEIEEKEGDIVSVLRLSYEQLPAHLKQCYISCSLFPKNHSFEKDDLLQMWMALGFVQANDKYDRMEDIGQDLINELSSRSFFVNAKRKEDKFVIHAVLHELADCISDGEYFRLDGEYEGNQPIRLPDKARHIYVTADNLVMFSKILCKKENVRSLVVAGDLSDGIPKSDFVDSLKDVLDSFKCLRLLMLSVLGSGLPKAIGGLKHLRYLEIPGDVITEWPESFCKLYHLQWVNLKMCSKNLLLPEKMNRLIRLRRLIPSPEAISTIAGVGKLTSLQELKKYHVQLKEGFEVGQLSAMNQLQGKLCISNLQHVESLKKAEQAMLRTKEHLSKLKLHWDYKGEEIIQHSKWEVAEKVIEGLKPHSNLRKLTISGYKGCKSPTWMKNKLLSNLEHLKLRNCGSWKALPPFGELPLLKILHIRSLSSIGKIDTTFFGIDKDKICVNPQKEKKENNVSFPSLEELLFDGLENWNAWDGLENGFELFPCLRRLFIWNCNNLRGPLPLPSFPRELTILLYPPSSTKFPKDTHPTSVLKIYTNNVNLIRDCLEERNRVLLCTLEIHGIFVLRSVIEKDWFFQLNSLKQLVLVNCGTYNPPELQNISFPIIRRASDAQKLNTPPAEASSKELRTRQRDEDQGWNTQPLSTSDVVHMPTPEKTDNKRSKIALGAKQDDASN
ncbi:NB-ARC domain [Musa troglodytarum]|uniref:NB-ARC domain n=2 Tax=Musa troglodytarum TaxID=320322 RepID=A0A9E7EPJ6_9LILI|nr:NB-ARC domain [Musa troglodytarum]